MKRPMTLVSGILGLVSHVVTLIISVIGLIGALEWFSFANDSYYTRSVMTSVIILCIFGLAISVIGLIFNILTITKWNKATKVYKSTKGKIIVAIVFNFLGIVIAFLVGGIIVGVITMLMYAAAIALAIVDLCLENKRAGNVQQAPVEAAAKVEAPKATALEEKIEKLNEMKSQGLISEEEYDELKKSYIKEQLSK